jgi:hypothetical protein
MRVQLLAGAGVQIKLSEHLLWPHIPELYRLIDGYNLSCEAHEYQWKVVRKLWPAIDFRAEDAITQLTLRICAQNFARFVRVQRHDRVLESSLNAFWTEQSVGQLRLTGDTTALQALLLRFGFHRRTWWYCESDGTLVLRTAQTDPDWFSPELFTIAQTVEHVSAVHALYLRRVPSIANRHMLAHPTHPAHPAPTPAPAPAALPALALPIETECDGDVIDEPDSNTVLADSLYSSDEELVEDVSSDEDWRAGDMCVLVPCRVSRVCVCRIRTWHVR